MKTIHYLIVAAISLMSLEMAAQNNAKVTQSNKTTLLLPDGSVLDTSKFDSIKKAWGEDNIIMSHTEEDFEKGIYRLSKKTDQDIKNDVLREQTALSLQSMLNKAAPQFELTDVNGKKWSLKQLRGKKVVLNFWFNSCAPCIAEMPHLNELVEKYKDQNVVFLGLTSDTPQQVQKFLTRRSFKYKLLPNSREINNLYNISSCPVNIVIDSKGIIRLIESYSADVDTKIIQALETAE